MPPHQFAESVAIVLDDCTGDQLGVADRSGRHQDCLPDSALYRSTDAVARGTAGNALLQMSVFQPP